MHDGREGADLDGHDPGARWIADELRRASESEPVDAAAVERVMRAVRERPRPRRETPPETSRPSAPARRQPAWRWLVHSRPVSLSPLVGAALAASIAGIGALGALHLSRAPEQAPEQAPARAPGRAPGRAPVVAAADAPARTVRFVLVAQGVSRVSVVGDFNNWNAAVTPLQRDAANRWSVEVPLPAGRYAYAFVLDGRRWVADPSAPLAPEDGFGTPNSVVVVGPAT